MQTQRPIRRSILLWTYSGRRAALLEVRREIVDLVGQRAQLIQVLASVVAAEEEVSARGQHYLYVGLSTAAVAAIRRSKGGWMSHG